VILFEILSLSPCSLPASEPIQELSPELVCWCVVVLPEAVENGANLWLEGMALVLATECANVLFQPTLDHAKVESDLAVEPLCTTAALPIVLEAVSFPIVVVVESALHGVVAARIEVMSDE